MKKIVSFGLCVYLCSFCVGMKIYRYEIGTNPICVESGRYYDNTQNQTTIGFGKFQAVGGAAEITEDELIAHAQSQGYGSNTVRKLISDKKKQYGELPEPTPTFTGNFLGKEVHTKKDVEVEVSKYIAASQGGQEKQLQIIGETIALLLAYQGKIAFSQCGIGNVTDIASADVYVTGMYNTMWQQRNTLRNQAKQYILDNTLK